MEAASELADERSAWIEVVRSQGGSSRYRAFGVFVDGAKVGTLRRGQTLRQAVAPGCHEVHAAIDWSRSRAVELDVSEGETVKLICRTRWTDPFLALWVITIGRKNYPVVERPQG